MISSVVYTVFEALAILFILHGLYDEKVKIEKYSLFFLAIDIIAVVSIDFFGAPEVVLIAFYVTLILYSGLRFGFEVKKIVINCALCLVITSIMQFIIGMLLSLFNSTILIYQVGLLLVNGTLLLVCLLLYKTKVVYRISKIFLDNKIFTITTIAMIMVIIVYSQVQIKFVGIAAMFKIVFLFSCAILLFIMAMSLGKSIIANKKLEAESRLQRLYNESFETLVTEIRMRQHEFDNHLNAIKGLKYTTKSYEELIAAQEEYVDTLIVDNKYNKILQLGNSILAGFLYNKFKELELINIDIKYRISTKKISSKVPVYTMVELIGNLIDNAKEALLNSNNKRRLYIEIIEELDDVIVEIGNENEYISHKELQTFFQKGRSTKGKDRGYGLYHVKKICDENNIDIICRNKDILGNNYISLCLKIPKGTKNDERKAAPLGKNYSSS